MAEPTLKVPAAMRLPDPPDPKVWESAARLTPVVTGLDPRLVSDGGGLPFTLHDAFTEPSRPLDPSDPRVQALLAQIELGRQQAMPRRLLRARAKPEKLDNSVKLAGWRLLSTTENEAIFARGTPQQLLTVAVRRAARERWEPLGATNARPLRAFKDGARASLWRIDPNFLPGPEAREVRVLLTEISKASGAVPDERLLTPEIHLDDQFVTLRLFVQPLAGYVGGTRRHETPVIVQLPEPLGERRLRDGGLYPSASLSA